MNMRAFWWIALAFTAMWIWFEWMKFSAPTPVTTDVAAMQMVQPADVPSANFGSLDSAPAVDASVPQVMSAVAQGQRLRVVTDTLDLVIDTMGGDIRDAKMLQHGMPRDRDTPFHLMSDQGPLNYYAQNGLAVAGNANLPAPTHRSVYQAEQTAYHMSGDTLRVPMRWMENGIEVTKTYVFTKGSYLIDVEYEVKNTSDQAWSGSLYSQFVRTAHDPYSSAMMYTYTGPVYFDGHSEDTKYN